MAAASPEIVDAGDGVRLLGYHSPAAGGQSRGLVILLHGWEGSADSHYMLSLGAALRDSGFAVFRLNFRDHGETQALNEGLFHSCRIDEVVNAVRSIERRHAPRSLALAGHSLGGNFAVRVALRAPGAGIPLSRVIAVCPVLKPTSTMRALEEGFWLYRDYFLSRWRRSLQAKAAAFPQLYAFGDLRRLPTLTATTDFFVRRYTDFGSLEAYLNGYALTDGRLAELSVPTRMILAADDPVIPVADVDELGQSPALTLELSAGGGHCGFVDALGRPSWTDRQVVADLERHL
jgi:hypothetical protein